MAWQEQLEALGIDNSNMPNMIKKAVKELYEYQSASERISKILDRDDLSDRKREEYEEQQEQLESAIEQQELVVEKKIAQWDRNKDAYAERIEKMQKARGMKKGGSVAKEETTQAPPSAPAGVEVQTPSEPTPSPVEPKKKGGFGWIALGIVVAVLTAGAVIINKDE